MPGLKREGKKQVSPTPRSFGRRGGSSASRPGRAVSWAPGIYLFGSGAGRMLIRRGARAGRGMPRGWTTLCLLSLLREYGPSRVWAARLSCGEGRRSPGGWARGVEPRDPCSPHAPTPTAAPGLVETGSVEPSLAGTRASPETGKGWGDATGGGGGGGVGHMVSLN